MSSRDRTLDSRTESFGSYYNTILGPDVPVATVSRLLGDWRRTTDVEGNREGANPFWSLSLYSSYPALDGVAHPWWEPSGWLAEFVNYPIQYRPDPPDPSQTNGLLSPSELAAFGARVLAETSPSKPSVSVPTFIGELRDLPSLVMGFGHKALIKALKAPTLKRGYKSLVSSASSAIKRAQARGIVGYVRSQTSASLSWRFALRPMIKDLLALWDFRRSVNNRIAELQNLASKKAIRRRIRLSTSDSASSWSSVFLHNQGCGIDGITRVTSSQTVWGSVEWVPLDNDPWMDLPIDRWRKEDALLEPLLSPFRSYAARSTFGLTSNHAALAAWQLMPWSWMHEWFSPIGDLIAAGGTVGCTYRRLCVMRRSRGSRDVVITVPPPSWVTLSGAYRLVGELKERYPVSGILLLPFPSLPVLSGQQVSILGELALTRGIKP